LRLNRAAAASLGGPCRVSVVPGATHLFEEPGTLTDAALLARDWFAHYLIEAQPDRTDPTPAVTR
jgi:putative phosphoribosyl transferase